MISSPDQLLDPSRRPLPVQDLQLAPDKAEIGKARNKEASSASSGNISKHLPKVLAKTYSNTRKPNIVGEHNRRSFPGSPAIAHPHPRKGALSFWDRKDVVRWAGSFPQ